MVASSNPYEKYRQQDVLMANPVELIVMLYDGCIKQLKLSRIAIVEKNYERANTSLQKSQQIVLDLIMSLDFNYPIANELIKLYEFIITQICEININKSEKDIEPLIEILRSLRDSWAEVLKKNRLNDSDIEFNQV